MGDKLEDWVERLHQTGICLRLCFCTVKNAIVRALARDKAHYCNMHPDVIACVDVVNEGSKCNMVEKNIDRVEARRKKQCNEGRSEALQYFEKIKDMRLPWMVLLSDDAKEGGRLDAIRCVQ